MIKLKNILIAVICLFSLWAAVASADEASDTSSENNISEDGGEDGSEDGVTVSADTTAGVSFDLLSQEAATKTDIQFKEAVAEYIGTEVTWNGEVESADESLFDQGSYEIRVDVDGGDFLETAVLVVSKEQALEVPKDARISFTGTISEIDNTIALTVKITPKEFTTK